MGTVAPMSLVTYEEARPWAKAIKQKVSAREMPPWFIDKNVGVQHFNNDESLTDEEIATIVKWVDGGAVQGNPADMPPPRQFADDQAWQIGKPDRHRHSAERRDREGSRRRLVAGHSG